MTLQVVCLKWGDLYGPEYVNRLQAMVARHLTVSFTFHCMTDDATGINPAIKVHELPPELPKWWGKVWLFQEFSGPVLYLDLDTVIVDNIDFLKPEYGLAALEGFGMPFRLGSAVMSIGEAGRYRAIWMEYAQDPQFALMFCGQWGDGQWIQLNVGPFIRLQRDFPGKFVSFKHDCEDGLPDGAAVVCFHGEPRPHDVASLPWVREHWLDARAEAA